MSEFAGTLSERVEVEHWAGDPEAGEWVAAGDAWAALVPVDAGPGVLGEGRVARPRYRLSLWAREDIGLASRFLWRGRRLAVLRAEPDPRAAARSTFLVEDRG